MIGRAERPRHPNDAQPVTLLNAFDQVERLGKEQRRIEKVDRNARETGAREHVEQHHPGRSAERT